MATSTCMANILGSMTITTPIGSEYNLGVDGFPCHTSWWDMMRPLLRKEEMQHHCALSLGLHLGYRSGYRTLWRRSWCIMAINVLGLRTISMPKIGVSGCHQKSHCGANQWVERGVAAKKSPWLVRRFPETRMPLHRLAHFLDMILPQLSPMHTRWDDPRKALLCCHFFRLERAGTSARVRLQFLFTSRALIYMVRIGWERQPLLLFSDVHRIGLESFQHFQTLTNGTVNKHNVQMGLSEGHSVLLHFSQNGFAYQAVLVSMSSAPSRGKRGEHAMWKHAQPLSTDFAWLPEDVAQAFCSLALRQDQTRQYGSFNEIQLGFNEHYQAWLHIQDFITWERPGAWKSLESSAKCRQRGFVLDVEYNRTKPLAYCRHKTEENSSKLQCDWCGSCWLMSLWTSLMMKSSSGGHSCRLSTTETATSSQLCLPSCCHYLKAKLIVQLVGFLGLVKLGQLLQLS